MGGAAKVMQESFVPSKGQHTNDVGARGANEESLTAECSAGSVVQE